MPFDHYILEVTVPLIGRLAGLCPLLVASLSLRCRASSSVTLRPASRKIVDPSHYSFKVFVIITSLFCWYLTVSCIKSIAIILDLNFCRLSKFRFIQGLHISHILRNWFSKAICSWFIPWLINALFPPSFFHHLQATFSEIFYWWWQFSFWHKSRGDVLISTVRNNLNTGYYILHACKDYWKTLWLWSLIYDRSKNLFNVRNRRPTVANLTYDCTD